MRKPSFPRIIIVLFGIGVIDLIRAWQKHDAGDTVAVVIGLFVTVLLFTWFLGKSRLDSIDD